MKRTINHAIGRLGMILSAALDAELLMVFRVYDRVHVPQGSVFLADRGDR